MKRKYREAINEVAQREGVRPEVIYAEMKKAIEAGYNNPDLAVQAYWRKLLPDGTMPTPEELIEILYKEINIKK